MFDAAQRIEARRGLAHWIVLAACLAAPLGLVFMRFALRPDPQGFGTHEQLGLPACQSMSWFGVPCPGCGVTTSVTWFAHANALESLRTQPFGFALGLIALLTAPLAAVALVRGADLAEVARNLNRRAVWWALATVAFWSWVYKAIVCWSA